MTLRVLAAALLLVSMAGAAAAEDRVLGRWLLDEAAFRDQVERFYAAAIRQVPEAQRDQAEAFAEQAIAATVARMAGSSATFRADGTVLLDPADGRPQTGSWSRDGEAVVLEPAVDAPEATTLIGTFEGDRLRLTPKVANGVGFVMRRATE